MIIENMKQKPVYGTKGKLTWEDTVIEKNASLGFWAISSFVWSNLFGPYFKYRAIQVCRSLWLVSHKSKVCRIWRKSFPMGWHVDCGKPSPREIKMQFPGLNENLPKVNFFYHGFLTHLPVSFYTILVGSRKEKIQRLNCLMDFLVTCITLMISTG